MTSEDRPRIVPFRAPSLALGLTALFFSFLLLPEVRDRVGLTRSFLIAGGVLATWTLALWLVPSARRRAFGIELVKPALAHWLQACLQVTIYVYWGWYWPEVLPQMPLILAQVVLLQAIDALLNWSRGRNWRPGFGPFPIVFSLNLFLWFRDEFFVYQFLLVATCAFGKEFVRWTRDGRSTHIFNPAVFGLGLYSIVLISTGTTVEYTRGIELSTTLGLPPYIYLHIFVLGLVVQYLFAVTLMTFAAAASLVVLNLIYTGVTGAYQFIDTNIPIAIFLGLHLLMTDPATSPRTNVGRVMFGTLYGIGSFYFYGVLRDLGAPEFYDKLLTVPLMNFSVQIIDRVARGRLIGGLDKWQASFDAKNSNLVYMGGWIALFVWMLGSGFVQGSHPGASIDFWRAAAEEGKPRAEDNVVKMLRASAERGSPEAANDVGELFLKGQYVEPSLVLAMNYFSQACNGGNLRGCGNLVAEFLKVENAQPQGPVLNALALLEQECPRRARRRGCYLVGLAYETGRGRHRDLGRALELYRRAATNGNLDACKALARLTLEGRANEREAAFRGLREACGAGDAESCQLLEALGGG